MTEQFAPLFKGSYPKHTNSFLPSHSRRREVNQVLKFLNTLASYSKRDEGQTMAEYGVVLAVITIAVFGALALLSGNIVTAIENVAGFVGGGG